MQASIHDLTDRAILTRLFVAVSAMADTLSALGAAVATLQEGENRIMSNEQELESGLAAVDAALGELSSKVGTLAQDATGVQGRIDAAVAEAVAAQAAKDDDALSAALAKLTAEGAKVGAIADAVTAVDSAISAIEVPAAPVAPPVVPVTPTP